MENIIQASDHLLGKNGERVDNTPGYNTRDSIEEERLNHTRERKNLKMPISIPAPHILSASCDNFTQLMEAPSNSPVRSDNEASASIGKGRKTKSQPYRETRVLKPFPYFYYIDHTKDVDSDPVAPLTPTMSVPNFILKMHAILVCDSLSCIEWMPHGRSWKILNQSEFEKQVLPIYFTQGSISSFYRQANGWGFRRMLKGPDKGSFYNEHFIRGLPFLAKKMKRIGRAKVYEGANIKHEPDLWKINAKHPTPEELPKDSLDYIVLSTINKCVQEFGPKAKMPHLPGILEAAAPQPGVNSSSKKEGTCEVTSSVPDDGRGYDTSSSVMAGSGNAATTSAAPTINFGQVLAGQNSGLSHSQIQSLVQQSRLQLLNESSRGAQNLNLLQLIQTQANNISLLQMLLTSHAQQQQPMTIPAAYTANVLSSAGQYSSAPTITIASNLLANTTSQMGLQTSYGTSFPEASFVRNFNTIGQVYPHEAQQGIRTSSGLRFESVIGMLTSLLNNLSQSQSQPVTNSVIRLTQHPTIMPSQQSRQDQTNQYPSSATIAILLANLGAQHGQS